MQGGFASMKAPSKTYALWCAVTTLGSFLFLYPFFRLFISRKKWHPRAHEVNRVWGRMSFGLGLLRREFNYHKDLDIQQPAIYCANHTSFLDIPLLFLSVPGFFSIVGKSSLSTVPLFGRMFRTLYIPVNRASRTSAHDAYTKSLQAVDQGRSVVFFPEGKIPNKGWPNMVPFKNGPFKLAIERQIPIVPVTIPNNWIILPDDGRQGMRRHKAQAFFHAPISTEGMTLNDVEKLKAQTFAVINEQLTAIHSKEL